MPIFLIIQGNVNPWINNVAMMTLKTRKINNSLGYIPFTKDSEGTANAAASEIPPRMPAQDMMNGYCHGSRGSCLRIDLNSHLGIYAAGKHQMNRPMITTETTAAL